MDHEDRQHESRRGELPVEPRMAPGGEKPQNRPLSNLNTGLLPVKILNSNNNW